MALPAKTKLLVAVPALLAGLTSLAWFDVIPGGWTLRGLIQPHSERRAQERAEYVAGRLALFADSNRLAPTGAILFLGSSTIEHFPLAESFPGATCLNRGIGDETAPELLARLDASLPAAIPAGAVLYVGSLDFRRELQTPTVVRDRAQAVILALRERFEDLPVTLIGILSERAMPAERVTALAVVNQALADLAKTAGYGFVATDRPPITTPDGALAEALTNDRLHLGPQGYHCLARWLVEDGGAVGALLAPQKSQ